ncbi:MAG: response regulator [Leptospirales bacterium]|nr:response regulator [Leptospirales bacterium]
MINAFIKKYIFSESLTLDEKTFNMAASVGLITVLFAFLTHLLIEPSKKMALLTLFISCLVVLLIYLSRRFKINRFVIVAAIVILWYILLPLFFFMLGGPEGGVSAFFILGLVAIIFLSVKKERVILVSIYVIVVIATYAIAYIYPEFITDVDAHYRTFNNIQAIVISGFFIGCVILFQNRIFMMEKEKVDDSSKALLRQDNLLWAINYMAEKLLTSDLENISGALMEGMEIIGRCVDIDRIYIWKNHLLDGKFYYLPEYGWIAPHVKDINSVPLDSGYSYIESIPSWESKFRNNENINGPLKSLSKNEYETLHPYGIVSLLVVPVFLHNKFWGFVSFDNCHDERVFPKAEEDLLRSASMLLANAVSWSEMFDVLVKAREDALANTKAKSDFLSNMSHEIRTPMNAIIGMTSIGQSSDEIMRKNYALSKIEEASVHLLGVVNDILDMSKIEANKLELSPVYFNFEKTLHRVVDVINFRVDEKHQKFNVFIDENIPNALIGDDQRFSQVITNLLSNAVKFTPEDGLITLDAKLLELEKETCTLQIEVKDEGIGISKEQQAHLFGLFEQAESGISRKYGGTGLGLAISKSIVELLDGKIWVESDIGKGSTFAFTACFRTSPEVRKSGFLSPDVNRENLRILAVDDDANVRAYILGIMKRLGADCDVAADAEEAIGMINENPYNIYFLDWKMPDMNGIELTKKIKEQNEVNSVVVMISATDWTVIEKDAQLAGVDKFIAKPIFPSDIADCINECLGMADAQKVLEDEIEDFSGQRILLVEDIEINREIVMALLEPTNAVIDCAVNGVEALKMFTESPEKYDMIFMDVQMPEMDGYEATRRIRAMDLPKAKSIPIVAMTANVFREDIEKCFQVGMDAHIGKPIDLDQMMARMHKYLKKNKTLSAFNEEE